jgi:hypothetical protein
MVAPLGGGAEDPGAPTINAKKRRWRAPLGGDAGDPRAPTINARNIDDESLGRR